MAKSNQKKSFWTSLPGILTGVAAIITAITGLYVAVFIRSKPLPPDSSVTLIEKEEEVKPLEKNVVGVPELVRWGPLDGKEAGICIDGSKKFIPWPELREEIHRNLLPQVGQVRANSKAVLQDYAGRSDWIVRVVGATDTEVVHIWFGGDPENNWSHDGLIRIGIPDPLEIFGTFQRYSDGSYRKLTK